MRRRDLSKILPLLPFLPLLPLLPLASMLLPQIAAAATSGVDIQIHREGERFVVDLRTRVAAPRSAVWSVLTDFDHMSRFLSSIRESRVTAQQGDSLQVRQRGVLWLGPLPLTATSLRAVQLRPKEEVRARLLEGDFRRHDSTMRLSGEPEGPTELRYHGEYEPTFALPDFVSLPFLEEQTRRGMLEMLAEMQRRSDAMTPPTQR